MDTDVTGETQLLNDFLLGQDLYNDLESAAIKPSDPQHADTITKSIRAFQSCSVYISQNDLFSMNEHIDEVASSSIKYLAIPFYLGELFQRIPTKTSLERKQHLSQAKSYYQKFILTFQTLLKPKDSSEESSSALGLFAVSSDPASRRTEKISRFRREKELKESLQKLMKERLAKGIDEMLAEEDEFERRVSLLLLEQNAIASVNALMQLEEELLILEHMIQMQNDPGNSRPAEPTPPRPSMPPFVIIDPRRQIKENAFKPGWNLPTVSIEEANWIDAQEAMQRHERDKQKEQMALVNEWREPSQEDEDAQTIKDREMDAWKDDNPKGSGNTGTQGYKY